jgi:hypothetical protein
VGEDIVVEFPVNAAPFRFLGGYGLGGQSQVFGFPLPGLPHGDIDYQGFTAGMDETRNRIPAIAVLCVFFACLNALTMMVFRIILETPLYLDTVFTAAAAFYGGLIPGVLTGLLTNLIINTVWFTGRGDYLYAICNGIVALVTVLFVRLCPDELDMRWEDLPPARRSRRLYGVLYCLTALFLLAFILVVALSVSGGLIAFCIKAFIPGSEGGVGPEVFYAPPLNERPGRPCWWK